MYAVPTWDEIDDVLSRVQNHQRYDRDRELLERARTDLAVLRHVTRVQNLQQVYSRARS